MNESEEDETMKIELLVICCAASVLLDSFDCAIQFLMILGISVSEKNECAEIEKFIGEAEEGLPQIPGKDVELNP